MGASGSLAPHGPESAFGAGITANLVVRAVQASAKDTLDDGGLDGSGGGGCGGDVRLVAGELEVGGGGRRGQRLVVIGMLDGAEGAFNAFCAA